MTEILRFKEADRPSFTEKQEELCGKLIGMGLTRLTIVGLVIGKDVQSLNHAEVSAGQKLIASQMEELGYGVMDARRAGSPFMVAAVRDAARSTRIRVRIA